MKVPALIMLAVALLTACRGPETKVAGCPPLERLQHADPKADAADALSKGDRRLLSLGGFVGVVPGAEQTTKPTRQIDETSDTVTPSCAALRGVAERYARTYNEAINLADLGSSGPH
jgi:hypothetical protein